MSQDKEFAIKLQFLDEAQDYLSTLESALIGISSRRIDREQIDDALRAAHSIKGGAGMMGFGILSQLAHRLEDSFKVLKTQHQTLEIEAELEGWLLAGVDCLRRVIDSDRHALLQGRDPETALDPMWLDREANPVFDRLYERLGDPQADDAASMLSPEEGQDVMALLFETEVEGCLQRLESVLADPNLPCLTEELEILAQELGGLGEMLQLGAFTQLSASTLQALAGEPHRVQEIARAALGGWRRSQALIAIGQLDLLPDRIELPAPSPQVSREEEVAAFEDAIDIPTSVPEEIPEDLVSLEPPQPADPGTPQISEPATSQTTPEAAEEQPQLVDLPLFPLESEPVEVASDEPEVTVRIPVKRLEQLNDLFGELIIDRNGLDLQLARLRNLVTLLSRRTMALEQTNERLRTAYDRIASRSQNRAAAFSSLLGKNNSNHSNRQTGDNALSWRWESSRDGTRPDTGEFDVLELDRYNELHQPSLEVTETVVQIQEVTDDIKLGLEDTEQIARNLNKSVKQLQTRLNQVRMRPLSDVLDRFPRALRELSLQHGKSVELRVTGGNTLVDRNILEVLKDPLLHLLRNAFDHGIEDPETRRTNGKPETGTIEIRATHRSNRTLISLRDDGAGIPLDRLRDRATQMGLDAELLDAATDRELLSLIFEPGFSTKDQVTDLSGRGVGMDVVRNNLKKVQGDIQVDTQPGVGTTFSLMVPFTLSVTRVLVVESGGMLLAFPSDTIQEILPLRSGQTLASAGSEVLNLEGTMVQLVRPERWFEFRCPHQFVELEAPPTINTPSVLISERDNQLVGLAIDRCWGEREVAIRPVEGTIPLPSGFTNCAILGDGRVVPLVNVSELLHWITSCDRSSQTSTPEPKPIEPTPEIEPPILPPTQNTILIVDDSINVRRFLALTLEKAGYRVEQAKDGRDAVEKLLSGVQVQAAICDIEMPRLDGYGFLAQVKSNAQFKDLPVMMLTSRTSEKHRRLATSLGATAYFSKPYNERALLQALETSLELVLAL